MIRAETRPVKIFTETFPLSRIDWRLLAEAVEFYTDIGYLYTELPYFVPEVVAAKTFDGDGFSISSIHALVGSAEQSFLNEDFEPGRYLGVTPCFRKEYDGHTRETQPHFMKVELFDNRPEASVQQVLFDAQKFMRQHNAHVTAEVTSAGMDLMIGRTEVGSYGRRKVWLRGKDIEWVYGTGLALPRFTVACE